MHVAHTHVARTHAVCLPEQAVKMYLAFTPLSTILGNYLSESLHWNEYLVTIILMLLNFVTEYLFDRFVVFGKSLDTNEIAQREKAKQAAKAELSADDNNE